MGASLDRLKKANLSREEGPRKSLWGAKASQRRQPGRAMSAIVNFLEEKGPDASGRSISTILAFDDAALERHHDFIQWLFPLADESSAVPGSPILLRDDVDAITNSQTAQWSLLRASDLMSDFYSRTDHWLRSCDHNHLRITRIIKSLRLLAGHSPADEFRQRILDRLESTKAPVSPVSRSYWMSA